MEADTVEQLIQFTEDELFDLRGLGVKLVVELRERLADVGLTIKGDPALPADNGE